MELLVGSPVYFQNFFLILVRCTTVFMAAPIFSTRNFPIPGKVGLGLFLSMILLPLNSPGLAVLPDDFGLYVLVIGQEVVVGLLIGFAAHIVFSAAHFAASLIGLQIGFSFPGVMDPTYATQTSFVDQFYSLLAALIFLAVNGHQLVILAMQRSFDVVPLGQFAADGATLERLIAVFTGSFGVAVRISLPVVGALVLADVALGLLARTVPTLNVLIVGLPIKILIGLVMIGISLPFMGSMTSSLFSGIWREIGFVVRGA